MSNLLQEIEAQIAGVKTATAKQNVGTVREIGDGVAKIEGLTERVIRLEATLELMMRAGGDAKKLPR